MDLSTPDVPAAVYVNSASDLTSAHVKHKQRMCSESEENVAGEIEASFSELVYVQELMSDCSLAVNDEEFCGQEEDICEEVKLNQVKSSTPATVKVLGKSATFPCSGQPGCPVSAIGDDEIPERACDGLGSVESAKPAWARSISLPTCLKPKSAMKGSRERRNGPADEKTLTVTWAPEVYDPPITSVSHSVKGYTQQRSRSNKKNSKHKHKGKASRGSTEKEKKQYRKHSEPRPKSTQGSSSELFHQQNVDFLESNCGSSFLRSSAGTVHISFAEAT